MPRKPLAVGLLLTVALLTATACSSSGDSPSPGDKSPGKTTAKGTGAPVTKLVRQTGKDDIKNVILKTGDGAKVSLSAHSPGHEVKAQIYDPVAESWSEPTSVFKDDTRFCHEIKAKARGATIAATVICSISAQDVDGTQSSYVLGSTDGGKIWKRMDLDGASGKPIFSGAGNFVAWSSPTSFLMWNPRGAFTTVKNTQSAETPTVGVMQSNGVLLMITATPGKKDTCTISFKNATAQAPVPRFVNSTLPQEGHPKCVAVSAKFEGTDVIANFDSTSTTKDANGEKVTETTTFALAFTRLPTGKWIVKH